MSKQKPKGLGDVIANVTKKVGIKQCGGCKRRQATLNKLVPFKKNNRQKQKQALKQHQIDPDT